MGRGVDLSWGIDWLKPTVVGCWFFSSHTTFSPDEDRATMMSFVLLRVELYLQECTRSIGRNKSFPTLYSGTEKLLKITSRGKCNSIYPRSDTFYCLGIAVRTNS